MMNPTDEELMSLVPLADPQSIESTDLKFYLPKSLPSDWDRDDFIAPPKAVIAFARAVLARYGHHPAPPVEGEVGDPGEATDEELWDIGERHLWTGTDESVTNYRILTSFIEAARVVVARYGHQPASPVAEGEVVKAVRPSRRQLIMLADDMGMASVSEAAEYARAVLARYGHQPAPPAEEEGLPSDQEIADVFSQGCRDLSCSHEPPFLGGARAILARWGRPALVPAPPAEGEVAELVAWMEDEADQYDCIRQAAETSHKLRRAAYLLAHHHPAPPTEGEVGELVEGLNLISDGMDAMGHESDSWFVARAADLLEQHHPAPVPVSERLPEPKDCDGEGKCWWWYPPVPEKTYGYWLCEDDATDRAHNEWPSAWLPIYAIQVPTEKPKSLTTTLALSASSMSSTKVLPGNEANLESSGSLG